MRETFIHTTADVSPDASIGNGTLVWNNAQVREGARVGAECIIGKDVYIDKDVVVGNRVKVQNAALLYWPLSIGDGVFVGPGTVFTNDRHPRAVNPVGQLKGESDWSQQRTNVSEGASIGASATVLPGVNIGAWALVGAGALVTGDVPAHRLVLGSPARPAGWVCRCGETLCGEPDATCSQCGRIYQIAEESCSEITST